MIHLGSITSNVATSGGDIRRKFVHQHKVCRTFTLQAAKTLITIRRMALAKPNVSMYAERKCRHGSGSPGAIRDIPENICSLRSFVG